MTRHLRAFGLVLFTAGLGACASAKPAPTPTPDVPIVTPREGVLVVEVVDVGQGDGIIIRSPTGKSVMLDAGDRPGWQPMLAQLAIDEIETLDLAIISHPHADHIGGMQKVLEKVPTKLFLNPGFDYSSGIYTRLLEHLASTQTQIVIARAGRKIDIGGGATIEVLAPREPLLSGTRSDANANSVVFRLVYGTTSMLFTGDSEAPTENRVLEDPASLASDILKVAHHGSEYSTQDSFLEAVHPHIAVISCGVDNKFGHPAPSTVAKLERAGIRILRTDLLGTITLVSDGARWTSSFGNKDARPPPPGKPGHPPPADVPDPLDAPEGPGELREPQPVPPVVQVGAPDAGGKGNLNTATIEQLTTVDGIGPAKAAAILAYRSEHGAFVRIEDLMNVPGIGKKTMARIAEKFMVLPPKP